MNKKAIKITAITLAVAAVICIVVVCAVVFSGDKSSEQNQNGAGTYTVSYVTGGASLVESQQVVAGGTATKPADPVREGFKFSGWFTDEACTNAFDFSTPINSNLTLYAGWTKSTLVQFDSRGGDLLLAPMNVRSGESVNAPDEEPNRVGYAFGGWYTDTACAERATFPFVVRESTTFYAKWIPEDDSVTITFRPGMLLNHKDIKIEWDDEYSITLARGEELTQDMIPSGIPTGIGNEFTGTNGDGEEVRLVLSFWNFVYLGTPVDADIIARLRMALFPVDTHGGDLTLYAMYVPVVKNDEIAKLTVHPGGDEDPTVMYGVKGGSIGTNIIGGSSEIFYSAPNNREAAREGKSIGGFYKNADMSADNIYEVPFALETTDNHVYIRWDDVSEQTVTFKSSDSGEVYSEVKVDYNGFVDIPESPFREGYAFGGWYKSSVDYEEGSFDFENTRITGNTLIVARWVEMPGVTITFDTAGGHPLDPVTVTKGETPGDLPVPVRDGSYVFDGWYTVGGSAYSPNSPVTGDMTLTAIWENATDLRFFEFYAREEGYEIAAAQNVSPEEFPEEILIPDTYNGKPVIWIRGTGFAGITSVKTVKLARSVRVINYRAFKGCTALEKLVVPDGSALFDIGFDLFEGCESLASIEFQGSSSISMITRIYNDAFIDSPLMQEQLSSVTYIEGAPAFYYWGDILLGVGSDVTGNTDEKGADALAGALTIGDEIPTRVLAGYALLSAKGLTELYLPDSLRYIRQKALPSYYSGWSKLQSISLPGNITTIDSGAYRVLGYAVENITVREGDGNYIEDGGCLISKSESMVIASEKSVTALPSGYKIVGNYAFTYKDRVTIPDGYVEIRMCAFEEGSFTDLVIPDSVGKLDAEACSDCGNLKSIKFGASLAKVQTEFFDNMWASGLSVIEVSEENVSMFAESNILYDKVTNELMYVPSGLSGDIWFPDSVTVLPSDTFGLMSGKDITSITFHDAITVYPATIPKASVSLHIGAGAGEVPCEGGDWGRFFMKALGRITSADDVLPELTISEDAAIFLDERGNVLRRSDNKAVYIRFQAYEETALYLDGVMTGVAEEAGALDSLRDVTQVSSPLEIGFGANFEGIESLRAYIQTTYTSVLTVDEANPYYDVHDNIIYTEGGKEMVLIPVGILHGYPFPGQAVERDIVLPKGLTEIPRGAFRFIQNGLFGGTGSLFDAGFLTYLYPAKINLKVEEGSELKSIAYDAFNNEGAIYAESFGYYDPPALQLLSVDLSNATKLESIGAWSFTYQSSLTEVILPDGVRIIDANAFANCTSLASIELPSALESIGEAAFQGTQIDGLISNGILFRMPTPEDGELTYAVPEEVTKIRADALGEAAGSELKQIRIHAGVTEIASGALADFVPGLVVLVEAAKKPEGWADDWNSGGNYVVWNCNADATVTDGQGNAAFIDENGIVYAVDDENKTAVVYALVSRELTGEATIAAVIELGGENYTVTAIGDGVFAGSGITSVIIPEGVTTIGAEAFMGSSVARVKFPETLLSVSESAFEGSALTSVTLLEGVTYGKEVFRGIVTLESLTIEDGVTVIPSYAFSGCTSLTSLVLPASLETVGERAFYECSSLASLIILEDSELTSIEDYAFYECALRELVIPVPTALGWSVFGYNEKLTNATITVSGTIPEYEIFMGCDALDTVTLVGDGPVVMEDEFGDYGGFVSDDYDWGGTKHLVLPEGLTVIPAYAFYESCVESITLGSGVTTIGEYAFANSKSFTSFTLPSTVTSIGERAFYGCSKLIEVYNKSSLNIAPGSTDNGYAGYYAKNVYTDENGSWMTDTEDGFRFLYDGTTGYLIAYLGDATDLILPAEFTAHDGKTINAYRIYERVFEGNEELTSVTIGKAVTNIGRYAFAGCKAKIIWGSPTIEVIDAYAFYEYAGADISIPDGVTEIGEKAFYSAQIDTVSIPSSVKTIGDDAFSFTDLVSIDIENGLETIGMSAFDFCPQLETVTIRGGVTSIGDYAFRTCRALQSVEISGAETLELGNRVFDGCRDLTSVKISGQNVTVGDNVFNDCTAIDTVMIEGLVKIGTKPFAGTSSEAVRSLTLSGGGFTVAQEMFSGLDALESLVINGDNITLGKWAFYNDPALTTVEITGSKIELADQVFYGCSSLDKVTIDGSNVTLGSYIFRACTAINEVSLKGVVSLGSKPFYDTTSVVKLTLSGSGFTVAEQMFRGLTALESVVISGENITLGNYAFYQCTALESVTFSGSGIVIGQQAFQGCTALTSVGLSGVSEIGHYAFYQSLSAAGANIYIPESVKVAGTQIFSGSLAHVTVYFEESALPEGWNANWAAEMNEGSTVTYAEPSETPEGGETGTETGSESGSETGGTGSETGTESGEESGGTGSETGTESGEESGAGSGTENGEAAA